VLLCIAESYESQNDVQRVTSPLNVGRVSFGRCGLLTVEVAPGDSTVLLPGSVVVAGRLTDSSFVIYSITLAAITSASCTSFSISLKSQHFIISLSKLHPSTVCLRQYDVSSIPIKGEITATVSTKEQSVTDNFVIVDIKNYQLPLLGRDWLLQLRLDWHQLLQCCSLLQLQGVSLQQQFPSIFKQKLGFLVGMEAEIELKEGAKPKFCKSHQIPFTLREKVEEAIQQQVADGELDPVDHSVWAAPIVVVTKKSGDICICADFKMMVNPSCVYRPFHCQHQMRYFPC